MTEVIAGTCLMMCPEKERQMREREGLLHMFEIEESTKGTKRPKANLAKVIKSYGRPAAGQVMTESDQLRPASILLYTIKYLFKEIVTRDDVDWVVVYDFVFDRLRAIRQDVVIQRINANLSVPIFESMIRFFVYSSERLCERKISEYDAKMNNSHLCECIKHLLVLYDQLDSVEIDNMLELARSIEKMSLINNRAEMEAIYILMHLGDKDALQRGLSLPRPLRCSTEIYLAMKVSLAWYLGNYARCCSLIRQLPPLLLCAAMINLQSLRRTAIKIMSSAYNSKVLTYPAPKFQEVLLYQSIKKVEEDCQIFGLTFANENILFQKSQFNEAVQVASSEMYYTRENLVTFLPSILLGSV